MVLYFIYKFNNYFCIQKEHIARRALFLCWLLYQENPIREILHKFSRRFNRSQNRISFYPPAFCLTNRKEASKNWMPDKVIIYSRFIRFSPLVNSRLIWSKNIKRAAKTAKSKTALREAQEIALFVYIQINPWTIEDQRDTARETLRQLLNKSTVSALLSTPPLYPCDDLITCIKRYK